MEDEVRVRVRVGFRVTVVPPIHIPALGMGSESYGQR